MDDNGSLFYRVECQIVKDYEESVAHAHQFFFLGDSPEVGLSGQEMEVVFDAIEDGDRSV